MIKIIILLFVCYLGSEVRTYRDANVEWTETSESDAAWESTITTMREQMLTR